MRLENPMFKGPLKVQLAFEEVETPRQYLDDLAGKDLPKKIKIWKIDDVGSGNWQRYGITSPAYGFEDSPDAELISSGINSTGFTAAAISRHGNFLQWGFTSDPSQMTESARRVFVNALIYMKRFDGQEMLVTRSAESRDTILQKAFFARRAYDGLIPGYPRDLGERFFPKDVWRECGGDAHRVEAYYHENIEYISTSPNEPIELIVDKDLQKCKTSNRKPEFLDLLRLRLRNDLQDSLALALARRYLPDKASTDAQHVLSWIEEYRGRVFFSDVGGYRWRVDPRGQAH